MSLRKEQSAFVNDIAKLIQYADTIGIELTFGEAYRTEYQQKEYLRTGKTKTMRSNHLRRLAIDFNFFIDGELTYDKVKLQRLGDYWESLNNKNRWGGNWKTFEDTPHFERNVI